MLTNGRWKHYNTVFTSTGSDYETFVLNGLESNSEKGKYVANNRIQVFVKSKSSGNVERWVLDPNEIFIQAYNSMELRDVATDKAIFSKLYHEDDRVYTSYLNEDKVYEIKFGNGVLGKKLEPESEVHVMYLESNGSDGYIDFSQIDLT